MTILEMQLAIHSHMCSGCRIFIYACQFAGCRGEGYNAPYLIECPECLEEKERPHMAVAGAVAATA